VLPPPSTHHLIFPFLPHSLSRSGDPLGHHPQQSLPDIAPNTTSPSVACLSTEIVRRGVPHHGPRSCGCPTRSGRIFKGLHHPSIVVNFRVVRWTTACLAAQVRTSSYRPPSAFSAFKVRQGLAARWLVDDGAWWAQRQSQ
jgi:hypothetical protein